jgi:hypothetical protein
MSEFAVDQQVELPIIRLLSEPIITTNEGAVLKILAVSPGETPEDPDTPVGYVSTKAGKSTMLGEFSGEPTGEFAPCNAVKGWISGNKVYERNVTTDTPFSGFRTAIAQKRAERTVKKRLSQ